MKTKPRVALITNILPHYRVPCFEALVARFDGEIDFFVLTDTMAHRQFVMAALSPALRVRVLKGAAWSRPPFDDLHLNDPRPALDNYDLIVLSGWDEPTFLLVWLLARLKKTRVAFWVESTYNDAPRDTWKESVKRFLLKPAVGAIAMGTNSAAYCAWLGVPHAKIFIAPNAADSAFFSARARELAPRRAALRAELGLQGVVILFVGRMVEHYKRVSVLLCAQQLLESKKLPAQLVLIGEGPDRAGYESLCRELNLQNVRFLNFLDHDGLARQYAAADIFVLPSASETWGLVINEAMEFGLPIVTTRVVGASADLVADNGLIVPPDDVSALASALETLVTDASLRANMGALSRTRIAAQTPAAWADGFAHGLETMLQ